MERLPKGSDPARRTTRKEGCFAYDIDVSALRLGDLDAAVARFSQTIDQHSLMMAWMKVDPMLDTLRSDARYPGVLKRVHLPE